MLRTWVRLAGRGLRRLSTEFARRSRRRELGRALLPVLDSLESRTLLTGMAANDTLVVQRKDVTLAIDVLANDVPIEGTTLDIVAVGTPSHGTATVLAGQGGAPPRISYVPDSGYTGTDSLTYTAEDEGENEDTATVTLTISPPGAPPTAPGGPRGMPTYRLSDGFVVGPYATFTPGASGNYSFTQVTTTTDSDTWTDANNVDHSVDTDTAETLTVTVTQGSDGTWAYSESFTFNGGHHHRAGFGHQWR